MGTNPTISWTAPEIGAPDRYTVLFWELGASGVRSELTLRGRVRTDTTSFIVPPDLLTPGKTYVISITAVKGGAPLTQPSRFGLPLSSASLMSGIVVP